MPGEDDDNESGSSMPQEMTFHVLTPIGRVRAYPGRGNSTQSKVKLFFDELINIPGSPESSTKSNPRKPRLIYVRDFPTLASSSATWYPPLLSAIRERRIGPISRPSAPIINPTTIVFGITPSITSPTSSFSPGPSKHVNLLTSRNPSSSMGTSGSKHGRSDWSEGEAADKEREKRLRERLRKWEKGDAALQDELPLLSATADESEIAAGQKSGIVVIGGLGGMTGFPVLESALANRPLQNRDGSSDISRFFRTSVLVPSVRSLASERDCRVARRREINELAMRMGVGAVGGVLDADFGQEIDSEATPLQETDKDQTSTNLRQIDEAEMWDDWGKRVEVWTTVKQIADRAVGCMVETNSIRPKSDKLTLEPTAIPWSAVHQAWSAQRSSGDLRKTWMKESSCRTIREQDGEEDDHDDMDKEDDSDILERIKQDPELDQHEQKLLPCIVDAGKFSVVIHVLAFLIRST